MNSRCNRYSGRRSNSTCKVMCLCVGFIFNRLKKCCDIYKEIFNVWQGGMEEEREVGDEVWRRRRNTMKKSK